MAQGSKVAVEVWRRGSSDKLFAGSPTQGRLLDRRTGLPEQPARGCSALCRSLAPPYPPRLAFRRSSRPDSSKFRFLIDGTTCQDALPRSAQPDEPVDGRARFHELPILHPRHTLATESQGFHLVRRGLKGDCTAAYIANKYSKYCKQKCPLNQTPQFEGTCKCRAPYKLQSKNCVPDCQNGYSINDTRTGCICRAGKVTNVDKTKCLSVCSGGSYPVGDGTCAKCPSPFSKCSSATVATACASGYLSAGQCVTAAQCPTGTWADKTGKACSPCADADAKSCSNGSIGTALSCNMTYLFNGTCVAGASLPSGYYGDDSTHTARACDAGVATCTGTGAGNALSCSNGFLLSGNCVDSSQCPSGTFADKVAKACLPCADPDASSCTDGKVGSALACNTQYLSLGTCVAAADIPDGYYPDDTTRTAQPCGTGVTKCTGAGDGKALACGFDAAGTPYFLTPDDSCLTECDWGTGGSLPSHICVDCDSAAGILNCDAQGAKQCGYNSAGDLTYLTPKHACELPNVDFPGYYPDDTTATFEPCNDGVETCVGMWDDQALSCDTRKDGTDLFFIASSDASEDASLGYCVVAADCPDGTTADAATHTCRA